MVLFGTRDLSAVQTAAELDLDALRAELEGTADGLLHGSAERDAAFELSGDGLGDELCVEVGLLDLDDVDGRGDAGEGFDLALQFVDLGALLADDDTGFRAVDEHAHSLTVALDLDLRDAGGLEFFFQPVSEIVVGNEGIAEYFVLDEPSGIPVFNHAHA